jgi:hypothetical protein
MTASDWFALDMLWEIDRLLDMLWEIDRLTGAVEPPKEET